MVDGVQSHFHVKLNFGGVVLVTWYLINVT